MQAHPLKDCKHRTHVTAFHLLNQEVTRSVQGLILYGRRRWVHEPIMERPCVSTPCHGKGLQGRVTRSEWQALTGLLASSLKTLCNSHRGPMQEITHTHLSQELADSSLCHSPCCGEHWVQPTLASPPWTTRSTRCL